MATAYHEIVVRGDEKTLKGFVAGFRAAKHTKGLFMCEGLPIETHHLREILTGHPNYEHMICTDAQRRSLVAALEEAGEELGVDIISDRRVKTAAFTFRFKTVSRKVATDIKRLMRRAPARVEFLDLEIEEDIDPSGRGVEMYSPVPEYRLEGSGKAQGDLVRLLRLHEKLHGHEFIDVSRIEIEH